MRFLQRLSHAGRRLDRTIAEKTGIGRLVGGLKAKIPEGLRKAGARYGPFVVVGTAAAAFALALSGPDTQISTSGTEAGGAFGAGDQGGDELSTPGADGATAADQTIGTPSAAKLKEIAKQFVAPPTAGVCGSGGILATGSVIQYPYAVQCHSSKFTGDNGGSTYRGVYRDKIRVALFLSGDAALSALVKAAGGCGEKRCTEDYTRAYVAWFLKYYETYGRTIELVTIENSGSDSDPNAAINDARRVAALDPPVFAVIGGPQQASPSYTAELKSKGILCFNCGTSPAQTVMDDRNGLWWGGLMSSHQAYIHRSEYVGKRLGPQSPNPKAQFAGDALTRAKNREFGFVWFDNAAKDYSPGPPFFYQQLAKYGITIKDKAKIAYTNLEGCQQNAGTIVNNLREAEVTSVMMAVDPLCPIYLTNAAQAQALQWEWIVLGSAYTDTNVFGRLYNPGQWSRAFGVSMNPPAVKDQNTYWYKMFFEVSPKGDRNGDPPKTEAPVTLFGPTQLFTAIHLAGPDLNPDTVKAAMAKAIVRGGTVTIPKYSYGPKNIGGYSFFDYTSYDDMTEIWWDPTQRDFRDQPGAYWYVDGAKRYYWEAWPTTTPKPFVKDGAIYGYEKAPDY